jgi:hypothetical protein
MGVMDSWDALLVMSLLEDQADTSRMDPLTKDNYYLKVPFWGADTTPQEAGVTISEIACIPTAQSSWHQQHESV